WLGRLYSDPVRWNPFASAHRGAAASEITELAERIGLADVLDRPADELSHADQKVLDIGVALAGKPTILLLDEPTQGVSPEDVGRIVSVITETMQDMAVVVIEHDIATVAAIATRVIVLDRGRVIAEGSLAEVSARPEVQEVYLGGGLAELLDEGWDGGAWTSAASTSTTARATPCGTCRSRCRPARSPPCWAATAPARPRR